MFRHQRSRHVMFNVRGAVSGGIAAFAQPRQERTETAQRHAECKEMKSDCREVNNGEVEIDFS